MQEPPLLLRHGRSSSSPEGSKARRAKSSLPLLDPAAILASPTSPMRALGIEAAWRLRGGGRRSLCTSFVRRDVQPAVSAEAHSILAGLAADGLPCFSVPPSAVHLLCSPTDFRTALLQGARTARRRVSLASLYLGDGPLEAALVDELVRGQAAAAAATCSAPRQLLCLLDYHRARRPGALLLPAKLSRAPGGRVCLLASPSAPRPASGAAWRAAWRAGVGAGPGVEDALGAARGGPALFASEQLAGGLSEILGVYHMKLALFDDDVVISGANLSHEYLTNRQDRYLLLRGVPALADWLAELLEQLAAHAHTLEVHASAHYSAPASPQLAAHAHTLEVAPNTAPNAAPNSSPATAPDDEPRPVRLRLRPPPSGGLGGHAPNTALGTTIRELLRTAHAAHPPPSAAAVARGGCWIAPVPQAAAAGVLHEELLVSWLLRRASTAQPALPVLLSSPYLNLPAEYYEPLLAISSAISSTLSAASAASATSASASAASATAASASSASAPAASAAAASAASTSASASASATAASSAASATAASPVATAATIALDKSAVVGAPPSAPPATTLLSAAPTASGFYGASGIRGLIPHVYVAKLIATD